MIFIVLAGAGTDLGDTGFDFIFPGLVEDGVATEVVEESGLNNLEQSQ